MRTSLAIFFVALTLTAAAAATTALDQYDSNNATYNNIIDYSSFEGVYHHQERKLSNLFSDDDDEQDDHIALNIFDDVDTGDEEGQRVSSYSFIMHGTLEHISDGIACNGCYC